MSDEPVLSRWSRLKRRGPEPEGAAVPEDAPAPPEESEVEALERLGLPEPETLGPGDDFSAFMGEGVPMALRRRALRVLWRSNPVLANLDGLVDYGEDFGRAELVPEAVATAWRIGKGFVKAAEREAEAAETAGEDPSPEAVADVAPEAGTPAPEAPETDEAPPPLDAPRTAEVERDPEPPRPRRMTFSR